MARLKPVIASKVSWCWVAIAERYEGVGGFSNRVFPTLRSTSHTQSEPGGKVRVRVRRVVELSESREVSGSD